MLYATVAVVLSCIGESMRTPPMQPVDRQQCLYKGAETKTFALQILRYSFLARCPTRLHVICVALQPPCKTAARAPAL